MRLVSALEFGSIAEPRFIHLWCISLVNSFSGHCKDVFVIPNASFIVSNIIGSSFSSTWLVLNGDYTPNVSEIR